MISAVTENRVLGVGTGTLVTMMVQSSSISTVIVIGFVNGGLMALHQAIAVIMGANIGTTITGWILVLKIGKYGLPIIGVAGMAYLFARTDRWRYTEWRAWDGAALRAVWSGAAHAVELYDHAAPPADGPFASEAANVAADPAHAAAVRQLGAQLRATFAGA